jgi:hypothetical protein
MKKIILGLILCTTTSAFAGYGDELITNGNFSAWSGSPSYPDSWFHSTNDANNYIVEVSGAARIVSDNSNNVYLVQDLSATVGGVYCVEFDVTAYVSGDLTFDQHTPSIDFGITGTGHIKRCYTATSGLVSIRRKAACDITVDNVSVKQYEPLTTISANDTTLQFSVVNCSSTQIGVHVAPSVTGTVLRHLTIYGCNVGINLESNAEAKNMLFEACASDILANGNTATVEGNYASTDGDPQLSSNWTIGNAAVRNTAAVLYAYADHPGDYYGHKVSGSGPDPGAVEYIEKRSASIPGNLVWLKKAVMCASTNSNCYAQLGGDALLLETGDYLLLETGDKLLLE